MKAQFVFLLIILLVLTSCKITSEAGEISKETVEKRALQAKEPTELSDCETMEDTSNVKECMSDIIGGSKDTKQCDAMEKGSLRNNCYSIIARNLGDVSICDKKFPEENIPKVGCYTAVAIKVKDARICAGIRDYILGVRCYSSLAASQKNIGICNNLKEDTSSKKECLTRVNFELGNCEALRNIASPGIYEDCKRTH